MRLVAQLEAFTRDGIRRRYSDAARWFGELDLTVGELMDEWRLEPVGLMHGGLNACVIAVKRGERPLVLKLSPSASALDRERVGLEAFAQRGITPRVLRHDRQRAALLMERFIPGQNLREGGSVDREERKLAELLWQLRDRSIIIPSGLPTVEDHVAPLLSAPLQRTGRAAAPALDPARRQQALSTLRRLNSSGPRQLIHGNLHPANVVWHGGRLAAVDPLALVGDPAYDMAEIALKRGCERQRSRHDPEKARPLATALASALREDLERVQAWMEVIYCAGA